MESIKHTNKKHKAENNRQAKTYESDRVTQKHKSSKTRQQVT